MTTSAELWKMLVELDPEEDADPLLRGLVAMPDGVDVVAAATVDPIRGTGASSPA